MTIEQKPELNRLADSSYPITWPKRWRAFKLTLPIWVFIWVCTIEICVLSAWLTNRPTIDLILSLTGGLLGGFVALWGVFEFQLWIYGRSKRILRIKDKHLVMIPAKHQYIRWKSLAQVQFEPIAENPFLTKLSIFEYLSERVPMRSRFAMIIENPAQVRELIQTLELRRQAANVNFKIVTLNEPMPPRAIAPLTAWAMSLSLAGLYFFLHGLPLLGIALQSREHHADHNSNFDPGQVTKLGQFLADHFSSVEQIRHFYLGTGIVLTLVGLVLMFWRSRLPDGKPKA